VTEIFGKDKCGGRAFLVLEIEVKMTPDEIPVVHLKGEIDLHTCAAFRDTLRDLIENKHYNIVINLAEVPYLDSAALGVLVDAVRRVREHDGSIRLVQTTPFVRRAFEITRLVKIFQLYDDTDTALSEIRTAQPATV
jgi:anti-sigma B factor antagonist